MTGHPDIEAASNRIEPYVRVTPVIHLNPGAFDIAGERHRSSVRRVS